MVKEAVSGTTLVDDEEQSYVSRLKTIDGVNHIRPDDIITSGWKKNNHKTKTIQKPKEHPFLRLFV